MIFPLADLQLAVQNLVLTLVNLASFIIVVYVLLDLARNFARNLPPFVIQVHEALGKVCEPVFRPIRNALPAMGGLDFSPLIVLLALRFIAALVA